MKIFRVPVVFQAYGYLDIEVESEEQLQELLNDSDFIDSLPLPDNWVYIDESFEIDKQASIEYIGEY